MPPRKRKKLKISKKDLTLRNLLRWGFVGGLWCFIFLTLLTAWYAKDLPRITDSAAFDRKTSIIVKAADGSVAARYGEIRGNSVDVADLPSHLIYAIIATEDRRFYKHFGLDPVGVLRAMVVNVSRGRVVQGGSTITQQLAKNLFLTHERTLKRKIQEAILALWLEHELTKDEILSAYLNRVYMGSGTFGVDAAAKLYFGHPATEVTLRESAMLAALLKAPSRYSPSNNPHLARERSDIVLRAMAEEGYITEEESTGLTSEPPTPFEKPVGDNTERYFTDWVVDGLADLIGTPTEDIIVETTLLPYIQENAEKSLAEIIAVNGAERLISQAAIIIMDRSGAVVAMIGGTDYAASQFNRAVQAKRPPGSSFKTIVYLTALENGWHPDDLIYDGPITEGKYRPGNYAGEYANGEVSLTTALTYSLNTAAVRLMKSLGVEPVRNMARRLGIYSPLEPDLSLALGSSGVSLLEMTVAYATIANDGYTVMPFAIKRITDKDGTVYYQRRARGGASVVDGAYVDAMETMLQSVVKNGTGRAADLSFPVAGKTGTSNDSRDAWFLGYNDKLVGGVWMGNDDNSPMKAVTGGSFPAQIWANVMASSYGRYRAAPGFVRSLASDFEFLVDRIVGDHGSQYEEYDDLILPSGHGNVAKPSGTGHYNP
jgi:penicillin-binding protein 1A